MTNHPPERALVDLASQAMATERDADEADEGVRSMELDSTPRRVANRTDPKLRAVTEMILSMPVDGRLRQLEEESSFFSSIRRVDD